MAFDISSYTKYIIQFLYLAGFGVFAFVFYKWNQVKRSIGWKVVRALGDVKMGIGSSDIVLRIKHTSGKEELTPTKVSPIINYYIKEKGEDIKKGVIYDERAVDRLNGIPILSCTPKDIRPIDRETGLLVNIPPEIMDKLAVDSSKTIEGDMKKEKYIKWLIIGLVVTVILVVIGLQYINQANTATVTKLAACYAQQHASAVITTK